MESPRKLSSPAASPTNIHGVNSVNLLKEQQQERDRLNNENFNMKLRINYLEEKLLRYTNGNAFENDDYENEILQLRLALEEKTTELNQIQIEAKDYIERLHSEMMEIKQVARQQKQETENGIVEHMTEELQEAKATNAQLQQNVQELGVRLDSAEKSLGMVNQEKADFQMEKARLYREIKDANHAIKLVNEEKSRLSTELHQVKTRYEDSKVQTDELRKHYDAIIVEKLELGSLLKIMTKKCEDFESKIEDLTQQNSRLRSTNELLESEQKQLSFEKDKVFVELKAAQIEIDHLKKVEEKQSSQFKIIESERDQLRLENLRLSSENNQALRNLESAENKKESQEVKVKNLGMEILKLDKACSEKDSKISSLETKQKNIETENKSLLGQLNLAKTHNKELTHKHRFTSPEAYANLESEILNLRNESQLIKCDLQAREKSLEYTEQALDQEKKKAKEYYDKLLQYESEIFKKNDFIEELERRFSEWTSTALISESVKLQQLLKSSDELEKEKKKLKEALENEREQIIILNESLVKTKKAESNAAEQLKEAKDVLNRAFGSLTQNSRDSFVSGESLVDILKKSIRIMEQNFEEKTDRIAVEWKQRVSSLTTQIDQLSVQLGLSHSKLETLKLNIAEHRKKVKGTEEKRISDIFIDYNAKISRLLKSLEWEKELKSGIEIELSKARKELEAMGTLRTTLDKLESECKLAKESNRVLALELEERRKINENARKQVKLVVKENKKLLHAVELLKAQLAERDQQIQHYSSLLTKVPKKKHNGVHISQVKDEILQQVEETQRIIRSTCKRIERGGHPVSITDSSHALDDVLDRIEMIALSVTSLVERAKAVLDNYNSKWNTFTMQTSEIPLWAGELNRTCRQSFREVYEISQKLKAVVADLSTLDISSVNSNMISRTPSKSAPWSVRFFGMKEDRTTSYGSGDLSLAPIYQGSLSSLGKIGEELQDIEQKIRDFKP